MPSQKNNDFKAKEKLDTQTDIENLVKTLTDERDRYKLILNSIPDEIWFADTNRDITLVNPQAVKEFNLNTALNTLGTIDVEKIASYEVYHSDMTPRPAEEAPPLRALKGEVIKNEEEIVRIPTTGQLRYRQVNAVPVRDKGRNIVGSISIIRDITERRKAEQALKERTELLEQAQQKLEQNATKLEEYANRMELLAVQRAKQLKEQERLVAIGQTAGMVGHDIRNPLQAITGDLYLALGELTNLPESEEKKALLDNIMEIEQNIFYIDKIVLDLQDYAKPLKPTIEDVDLRKVIEKVMEGGAVPLTVSVDISIAENFPIVKSNESALRRIIDNLVLNAVQAMPHGGNLCIGASCNSDKAIISVSDTGAGIPEEIKPKLFKPLFTTKSKGQGLGLAVVKKLADDLGAHITFDSKEGKGTTFKIELPISNS